MNYQILNEIKTIHFIGIGGAGMSGIAKVMLEMGYKVSGSDINKNDSIKKLEAKGAKIFIGHEAENIDACEAVVISTAISVKNPELIAARENGAAIFHRSDIVAYLMLQSKGIAVAGAHGKTTTTSMTALLFEKAGFDPTILIGGDLDYIGGNAKLGKGDYLIAEADESDGSFLKFSPQIAIITNIESDHLDYYHNLDNILIAFNSFMLGLPKDGKAIVNFDNEHIRSLSEDSNVSYISYGIDHEAEYMAKNIRTEGAAIYYDVCRLGEILGTIKLNVPGIHNVINSLAAVIAGLISGIEFAEIKEALALFNGAKRRFQTKGRIHGIWVVDDYAHHPTEIIATINAARQTKPRRLICVFQPHRYTRTKFLLGEFAAAFQQADMVILTDIYSAGEQPIDGITGETLKEAVELRSGRKVTYIQNKDKIANYLLNIIEAGDLIITMGAGNIYQAGETLVDQLATREKLI